MMDGMLPPDNHVHSEWSWDTPAAASMEQACRRAVEIGLPAVAFTEHLDFTAWGSGDAAGPAAAEPARPSSIVGRKFGLAVDVVEAAGFRPGRDPFDFWRR